MTTHEGTKVDATDAAAAAVAPAATVPARPAELTLAFLRDVLVASSSAASAQRLVGFSWKPLEVGVISEVVALSLEYADNEDPHDPSTTNGPVKELVAKFLRSEFPFEQMFVVESNFYRSFAHGNSSAFPFALPTALFLSSTLIILERVAPVKTYSCVQGCPADQIHNVVTKLAQMHGRFWHSDCSALAQDAGIGSNLTGPAKREQFPGCWKSFLDDVPLDNDARERVARVCERLSENAAQLERIHNAVANGPSTLIHGDFHAANLLFSSSPEASEALWLVDWATCGKGNPMRDLAFLFIVGVKSEDRAVIEASSLQVYYETIIKEGVAHLSVDDWRRHYRMCVLNQFLILAVYDNLSKHLASNAKTEKLKQELHAHFREVNVRACLAVLEHFDEAEVAQL